MAKKPIAVYGALSANLAIATTKFIAAFITGSSAINRIENAIRKSHPVIKHIYIEAGSLAGQGRQSTQRLT